MYHLGTSDQDMKDLMASTLKQISRSVSRLVAIHRPVMNAHPVVEQARPPLLGTSCDIDGSAGQVEHGRTADVADREIVETAEAISDEHMDDGCKPAATEGNEHQSSTAKSVYKTEWRTASDLRYYTSKMPHYVHLDPGPARPKMW